MGNYIVKSNIEAIYGVDNVAQWSNLDNDDAQANTTRIDDAISYGEAYIDDAFRNGAYKLPIIGTTGSVPRIVIDMAAKMAGVWLYNTRRIHNRSADEVGQIIQGHQDEVDSLLNEYAASTRRLDAVLSHNHATAPQVVV